MTPSYTAKLYVDKTEIATESGEDLEVLYHWMLLNAAQEKFGNLSGEITDNQSGKVVKRFRKAPPD